MNFTETAPIFTTDANPAPAGEVGYIKAADGLRLRAGFFPAKKPKAVMLLLTGYNEFLEKYFEVIDNFTARNYHIGIIEWRGQGLSDKLSRELKRANIIRFDDFLLDMDAAYQQLIKPHDRLPHVVLAHSMGGLITTRYQSHYNRGFTGIAQSAPFYGLGIKLPPPAKLFLFAYYQILQATADKGDRWNIFDPPSADLTSINRITLDETRWQRLQNLVALNDHFHFHRPSLRWLVQILKTLAHTQKQSLAHIKTPYFIGTASDDLLVSNQATENIIQKLPHTQHKRYTPAYHELLMETDPIRNQFMDDVDDFFTSLCK